jgi:hypothetical protein
MKSVGSSISSAILTLPISSQSGNRSLELSQSNPIELASLDSYKSIVLTVDPTKENLWISLAPSLATSGVAILVAYLVHKLTRQREREKAVYDLHTLLIDAVNEVRKAAILGWSTQDLAEREAAIYDLNWNLRRAGAQAQLLYLQSRQSWLLLWEHEVSLQLPLSQLRDSLTLGDFSNPQRTADPTQINSVEEAIVDFTTLVDKSLIYWANRSPESRRLRDWANVNMFPRMIWKFVDFYIWPISRYPSC